MSSASIRIEKELFERASIMAKVYSIAAPKHMEH